MTNNRLLLVFILLNINCNLNYDVNKSIQLTKSLEEENFNCAEYFANDGQSEIIFREFYEFNYQRVVTSKKNLDLTLELTVNDNDTTQFDTIIVVSLDKDYLKYHSKGPNKRLFEISLSSNNLIKLNGVKIGMSKECFYENFLFNYFNEKIKKDVECIIISPMSEFEQLYFKFKRNKLILIRYNTNVGLI